jgi:hypothetical protein
MRDDFPERNAAGTSTTAAPRNTGSNSRNSENEVPSSFQEPVSAYRGDLNVEAKLGYGPANNKAGSGHDR